MIHPRPVLDLSTAPFAVMSSLLAAGLEREPTRRFHFRVPPRWRSPVLENPFAAEAERRVLQWFESLGCSRAEVDRARKFDAAGYVGIPFPTLSRDKTIRVAKYLSLWLLWDDVEVETLEGRWRIDADNVLADLPPERMSRFDQGWWQLLGELAVERTPAWIERLCEAMAAWNTAAVAEAEMMKAHREKGELPTFERHLALRIATIGMFATVQLLEDAHNFELPREFHARPAVRRIETLAGQIVGLGNDILSLGKDCAEDQCNLVTTLMRERGLTIDAAIETLVHMHDEALEEYDRLGDTLIASAPESAAHVARWLQDLRYASIGFSLWESQAPRYTAHKIVASGRVLEPRFSFFPARCAAPPSSRHLVVPPSSRHVAAPQSARRRTVPPPPSHRFAMISSFDFPEDA